MDIRVGYGTDPGLKRPLNQDSVGTSQGVPPERLAQKGRLLVVADGFGKGELGVQASKQAVALITQNYYANPETDVAAALVQAVQQANAALHRALTRSAAQGQAGTTVTAAVIRDDELHVVSVGDSRAYVLRQGRLQQLTKDHTWVADQVRAGKLTPEQAARHPQRSKLSRALGTQPQVTVDHITGTVAPGDRLLLCTDGLTDLVPEGDVQRAMQGRNPQEVARRLVSLANRHGGHDNVAVVVASIGTPSTRSGGIVPLAASVGTTLAVISLVVLGILVGRKGGIAPIPVVSVESGVTPSSTPLSPTPTVVPTDTPAPTTSAVSTPVLTRRVTTAVGPGPTAMSLYAAPELIAPADGAVFRGPKAQIRLEWTSVGELGQDEYYVVVTDFPHEGVTWRDWQWTKETTLTVPRYLYDLFTGTREAQWRVAVWRRTGTKPGGTPDGLPVGEQVRRYRWDLAAEEPTGVTVPPAPTDTPTPQFEG